jgi:hypothetical protein
MRYSRHRCMSGQRVLLAAVLMAVAAASLSPIKAAAQGTTAPPATDSAPAASTPQPARWIKKKLFFVYAGLQTQYRCQGLTDQMREVLLQLGARKSDLDVRQAGCAATGNQFPGVAGSLSVLEPVAPEQAYSPNASPGVVAAHWQAVQVKLDPPGRGQNGQCELLQQVKSRILPLFTTRNVQFDSACSPRTLLVGRTTLRLEVLVSDERGDVASN